MPKTIHKQCHLRRRLRKHQDRKRPHPERTAGLVAMKKERVRRAMAAL